MALLDHTNRSLEGRRQSLYELINNWDQPARCRTYYNFTGSTIISDLWQKNTIGGGASDCTFTTDDSIDGGMKVATSNSASSPSASFTMNEKKQFNGFGCTFVGNMKKGDDNLAIKYGLADDSTVTPPVCILMCEGNLHSYKGIETNNESRTDSTVAKSTDYFGFKLECFTSNVACTINGVRAITKTTSIPNNIMQPYAYIQSRTTSAVKQWNTTFFEAYNT
jgi:hypothetical protein